MDNYSNLMILENIFSSQTIALKNFLSEVKIKDFKEDDFKQLSKIIDDSFAERDNIIEDHEDLFIPIDNSLEEYLLDSKVPNTDEEKDKFMKVLEIRKNILNQIKKLSNDEYVKNIRHHFKEMTYKLSKLSELKFKLIISRRDIKQKFNLTEKQLKNMSDEELNSLKKNS